MQITTLLDVIVEGLGDRALVGRRGHHIVGSELGRLVRNGAEIIRRQKASAVVYVGENDDVLPPTLFASSWAGVPFVPLNYRLADAQLRRMIGDWPRPLILVDRRTRQRDLAGTESVVEFAAWLDLLEEGDGSSDGPGDDPDAIAVVLYTSGTTAAPKAAVLRHRHVASYILSTIDFASADEDEAVLTAVPPYHVAGVASVLSNAFGGRRMVYLGGFDPRSWLESVRAEGITHAMVVPTMLARIVAAEGVSLEVPTLRSLAYGGARMPEQVLRRALEAFPDVDFVNAYGLTETSATIAVLEPSDHRVALQSEEPAVRRRLGSVGRAVPGVEVEIRRVDGSLAGVREVGTVWVRGEQVAGEYRDRLALDADGWFCTRDRGWQDEEGFLFLEGREDDVIVRGGENVMPYDIEATLMAHPAIEEACVVGVPDEEWGERLVAVVVLRDGAQVAPRELEDYVRANLRGSMTPDRVVELSELPRTDTGKVIRREVVASLAAATETDLG
jgi:acyl-CoA synthetase (AMP-forming)/AMP-acid ligase II